MRGRVGGRTLTVWTGTPDAVQRARGPGAGVRARSGADPSRRAADGRLVRREDVRSARGGDGGARPQGGSSRQARARRATRSGVTLNRHPATITVQLGARADGTLVAKQVTCHADTGAYADCGPGVAQKMGYAAPGPYRIPNVSRRRALRLHEPAAERRLPRLRRDAVGVGVRARDGRARRAARTSIPLELRLPEPAPRRRPLLHRRDDARRPLRGVPARRRRTPSAGARTARGKGLCLRPQGDADAEPRGDRCRGGRRRHVRPRAATTEMGQGARARPHAACRPELWRRPRPGRASPTPTPSLVPYDTRTTSSRSTHMMGRALARGGRRPARRRRESRLRRGRRRRAVSTPTPARGSPRRTGTRARRQRR